MKLKFKIYLIFALILGLFLQQGNVNVSAANISGDNQPASPQMHSENIAIASVVVAHPGQLPSVVDNTNAVELSAACLPQKIVTVAMPTYVQDQTPLNLNEPANCFSLAVASSKPVWQALQVYSRPAGQLPQIAVANIPVKISSALDAASPFSSPVSPILPFVFSAAVVWEFAERIIKSKKTSNSTSSRFKIFTIYELGNMRC